MLEKERMKGRMKGEKKGRKEREGRKKEKLGKRELLVCVDSTKCRGTHSRVVSGL